MGVTGASDVGLGSDGVGLSSGVGGTVGLGVPLFKAAAERCNGELTVTSQPGQGTMLRASFQHSHIDRAPLGDIEGTLLAFILSGACDLHYVHRMDGEVFEFHTADIRAELGDIPLTHSAVRNWLQEFIAEGETELRSDNVAEVSIPR